MYYTDSFDAARNFAEGPVLRTLCLYEDGTPDRWLEGKGDCFSDHTSFSERRHERASHYHGRMPRDVANYAMFRDLCADVEMPERYDDGYAEVSTCYRVDLDARRAELEQKYPAEELAGYLDAG